MLPLLEIDYVLLKLRAAAISDLLENSAKWHLIYSDNITLLFKRVQQDFWQPRRFGPTVQS